MPAWEPRSVEVGEWRITALTDGCMRLDGGSMWGVVPRSMWAQRTPPAEDNTIPIALRPFLAERGDERVLIEGGIGDRWEQKWRAIYSIEQPVDLEGSLEACGLAPEEITQVVVSHCHFDHIGALVRERQGRLEPRFPNARHFAPRLEVEVAKHPDHVRRASYRPQDVVPLAEAGLLETFEGDGRELLPGLRAWDASGHSDGVAVLTLGEEEAGETAIFWADVVPTAHHLQPPFIMAYDIDVPRSFASRSRWLKRAAAEAWVGLFYHDVDHPFGRFEAEGKRYGFLPEAGRVREAGA